MSILTCSCFVFFILKYTLYDIQFMIGNSQLLRILGVDPCVMLVGVHLSCMLLQESQLSEIRRKVNDMEKNMKVSNRMYWYTISVQWITDPVILFLSSCNIRFNLPFCCEKIYIVLDQSDICAIKYLQWRLTTYLLLELTLFDMCCM